MAGQPIAWVIWGIDRGSSIVLYVGMPPKLRIEYSGAMYRVMSRGDRRERIFLDDVDRLLGKHGIQEDTPTSQGQLGI